MQETMDALLRIMAKGKEYAKDIDNSDYKGLAEVYENAVLAEINKLLIEQAPKGEDK